LESARLKPKHFTRDRTLSFPTVLTFLLSGVQGAVQSELDQFFANLRNRADSVRMVSAQAFCKARYKISALVFGDVNQKLMAWSRSICRCRDGRGCGWWLAMARRSV
jgi:hypothetical protein